MTTHRFVIDFGGELRNFLSVRETRVGDLIVSPRGKRHSIAFSTISSTGRVAPESEAVIESITIHPNPGSEIKSVTLNYKKTQGGGEVRTIAGILGVRGGLRLFPVLASVGRNLSRPSLRLQLRNRRDHIHPLWPEASLDPSTVSLAYCLAIADQALNFVFPEDFPRNVVQISFSHLQILFIYWSFDAPTRFRGTSVWFSTPESYVDGMEFHELLNFTNDLTLYHAAQYESLPPL